MLDGSTPLEIVKYVPVQLSTEAKQAVADLVNEGKSSGLKVGQQTKINYRSVYRYAKKSRNGDPLHEKAGRPPILDFEAQESLLTLFASGEEPSVSTFRSEMEQARRRMLIRRKPNISEDELTGDLKKSVSNGSAKRYLKKLKQTHVEREKTAHILTGLTS
jgi:hypothetical protein